MATAAGPGPLHHPLDLAGDRYRAGGQREVDQALLACAEEFGCRDLVVAYDSMGNKEAAERFRREIADTSGGFSR